MKPPLLSSLPLSVSRIGKACKVCQFLGNLRLLPVLVHSRVVGVFPENASIFLKFSFFFETNFSSFAQPPSVRSAVIDLKHIP